MYVDIHRFYRKRFKFPYFLSLLHLGNKSLPTTSSTTQARFITQGHTYRAVVGETLTLPCEVENLGERIFLFLLL